MVRKMLFSSAVLLAGWGVLAERSAWGQDFMSRLDTNGNGMIDPNEAEGRMGFFLQRMAENNPRIDLKRPIPVSVLTEEMQRMRSQGGPQGGGGPGGRGGTRWRFSVWWPPRWLPVAWWSAQWPWWSAQWPRGDTGGRGGNQGGRDRGQQQPNPYASRETEMEPLVPGFGEEDVLSPPLTFGAEAELFMVEVSDRDREEARRAFGYYDNNRDGKIDKREMERSRYGADLPMYDKNRDGVITVNEMEFRYARRRVENTRDAQARNASNNRRRDEGDRKEEDADEDKRPESYRRVPAVERMPEGLPEWFARDDANGDGQIAMAEYATSWSSSVLDDFNQFDLNQDGMITPRECLRAVENEAERGGSIGGGSSSSSEDSSEDRDESDSDSSESSESSTGSASDLDPRYMTYAKGLVDKYDTNSDGALSKEEWSSMSKDPSAADIDGNGKITSEEYAVLVDEALGSGIAMDPGKLLLDQGLLTQQQLTQARERGDDSVLDAAIEMGFVQEEDALRVVGEAVGLDFVDLTNLENEEQLAELLATFPQKLIHRESLFPIRRDNGDLVVATSDPFNLYPLDELSAATGLSVMPVLAGRKEIAKLIKTHLGVGSETVEGLMAQAADDDEVELLDEIETDGSELSEMAQEPSVVRLVNEILLEAIESRASDVHIESQAVGLGRPLPDRRRAASPAGAAGDQPFPGGDHQPAEDHGPAEHRRETPAARRPDQAEGRRPRGRRPRLGDPDDPRRRDRAASAGQGRAWSSTLRTLGMEERTLRDLQRTDRAAARDHSGHRPDRLGQDDHAVQLAAGDQQPRTQDHHHRRPGRIPAGGDQPDPGPSRRSG